MIAIKNNMQNWSYPTHHESQIKTTGEDNGTAIRCRHRPVRANVPPRTAQRRVMKWRKLRRSSLIVTVIGERS